MRFVVSTTLGFALGALAAVIDIDPGAPTPFAGSASNLTLPPDLQVWNAGSLNLTQPDTANTPGVAATPLRMLCGASTNPPLMDCTAVIDKIRSVHRRIVVQHGKCVGLIVGGCDGFFCAVGAIDLSLTTDWIADNLVGLFDKCVYPRGQEGYGFECYNRRRSCSNWTVNLKHTT